MDKATPYCVSVLTTALAGEVVPEHGHIRAAIDVEQDFGRARQRLLPQPVDAQPQAGDRLCSVYALAFEWRKLIAAPFIQPIEFGLLEPWIK